MASEEEKISFSRKQILGLVLVCIGIVSAVGIAYYMQTDTAIYDQFGLELLDMNVALMDIYEEKGNLCIEYIPDVEDQFRAISEIGNIAFVFANHYEEYDVKGLLAKAVDSKRQLGATWECKGEWVDRYHEGNMSLNDLMWACVSTIETTEDN